MPEVRKSLKDYALQVLRDLLNPKADSQPAVTPPKKISLHELPMDDMKKEKIRLEQEERKMLARLREVESQKKALFAEGVQKASDREMRVFARRIKDLDVEANNMDRMLQIISKQMRSINGLIMLKERASMASESGLLQLIQGIDLQELLVYIDRASVDGEFQIDKFDELIRALEEADAISPQVSEDKDVLEIVRAMQSAREAGDSPEALEEKYDEFTRLQESKKSTQEEPSEEA